MGSDVTVLIYIKYRSTLDFMPLSEAVSNLSIIILYYKAWYVIPKIILFRVNTFANKRVAFELK